VSKPVSKIADLNIDQLAPDVIVAAVGADFAQEFRRNAPGTDSGPAFAVLRNHSPVPVIPLRLP
jgi:hypothetical protein